MSIHQYYNQFFKVLFYNHNDINKSKCITKMKIKYEQQIWITTMFVKYTHYLKKTIFNKEVSECNNIQKYRKWRRPKIMV